MRMFLAAALALGAGAVYAVDFDHSTTAGIGLGILSYEAYSVRNNELVNRAYKVAFHADGDFYRNDGRFTHNFTFDLSSLEDYRGDVSRTFVDVAYNVPIYILRGHLRPAVRPFIGGSFITGPGGDSQAFLGAMFGARYILSPIRCIYTDVYVGWKSRYGDDLAVTRLPAAGQEMWKDSIVLDNANTIQVFLPLCIYIAIAAEYDLTDIDGENRKPEFSAGIGPALFF